MTTIDITEHLAQFTACGVIVVDGERVKSEHPILDLLTTGGYSLIERRPLVAPELWRKLTEPCPRCMGDGFQLVGGFGRQATRQACLNPDCVGGRQVVTLTATCPTCGGKGTIFRPQIERLSREIPHWKDCPDCVTGNASNRIETHVTGGVVILGRFTIRLLPVVETVDPVGPESQSVVSVDEWDQAELWVPLGDSWHTFKLALDPLPQPGQWAVQFEAVASPV